MTTARQNPFTARLATASTTESRALLVAMFALVLGGVIGFAIIGLGSVPIAGRNSLGSVAAIVAAVISALVFAVGYVLPSPGAARRQRPERTVGRLVLDNVALALAHGFTVLLLVTGLSIVLGDAFIGAEVYPFSAALLVGIASALSAYVSFLSAAGMTTTRVATVMAVFLVVGVMTAMISASDPEWWQKNISALGIGDDFSSATFNITLIVAGVVLTAIASYLAAELAEGRMASSPRDADDRGVELRVGLVRWGLVLLGVFLACVGVFHVDWIEWVHNTFATGLVVIFAALVIGIRRLVPRLPAVFVTVGFAFLAVVVGASVLFAVGIYNLTAVEIIGFALIFTWLVLLIRNVSAGSQDAAAA
ncbi:hypothetical protein [Protaetiibacter mangrovi]|uniref:DUF998 domain-containing protein n=1 Tax=Protaetiibacter mangrovi TaxID=2970926 RepID=A0ABT1ZGX3_9MICO|nr:hypothetical protein [Protaetiibacter mangrovi]MCS0499964.1 hypothetical protein [Protaetiibacter mangrovi]TPX05662.1 hypothetical protein FJ656_05325 [Schumannella luteola]